MNTLPALRCGLIVISILAAAGSAHGDILIDSFSGPQSAPGGSITFSTADNAGIIGGERDLISSGLAVVSIDTAIPGQLQMAFRNDINPAGRASVNFTYDGNDNTASSGYLGGLGSLDLTEGGLNDRFRITISSIMSAPATLFFRVAQVSMSSTNFIVLPQTPGTVEIPFSSFRHEALGIFPSPVDFHHVGYLELQFEYGSGQAITIDGIAAVPEPSTSLLLLAALLTTGGFIRSRSRSNFGPG